MHGAYVVSGSYSLTRLNSKDGISNVDEDTLGILVMQLEIRDYPPAYP